MPTPASPRVTALVALLCLAVAMLSAQKSTPGSAVAIGNNQFAFELYAKVSADKAQTGHNIFVSPYSISTALAMTYAGARGNTRKQMATVLHFDVPDAELHAAFSQLLAHTAAAADSKYKLSVANALWAQSGEHVEPDFLAIVNQYYRSDFNQVDFRNAEPTRAIINQRVENETAGKIKDLLRQGDIGKLTRLVLTDAIYFKGAWTFPFSKRNTDTTPFKVAPGKAVTVPMMRQEDRFSYGETRDVQTLEMSYAGSEVSMLILLPKRDVDPFGAGLTSAKVQELRTRLAMQKVEVYLPRFKFDTRYYLEGVLSAMGMPDAFSREADFSGMTGKKELGMGHVIHRAMIEVNEEGSEAAAATATASLAPGAQVSNKAPVFRADHPFVFLIIHAPTKSILFLGRVSDPSAGAP